MDVAGRVLVAAQVDDHGLDALLAEVAEDAAGVGGRAAVLGHALLAGLAVDVEGRDVDDADLHAPDVADLAVVPTPNAIKREGARLGKDAKDLSLQGEDIREGLTAMGRRDGGGEGQVADRQVADPVQGGGGDDPGLFEGLGEDGPEHLIRFGMTLVGQ